MEQEEQKNSAFKITLLALLFSMVYAVMRYHIFGAVPWKDLPFFIFNKSLALCAYLLLFFTFTIGPLKQVGVGISDAWLNARKVLGMLGFLMALVHGLMSFMLFKTAIYPKFFELDGTLTLLAGLSMLFGVLSLIVLWVINLSFQTAIREDKAFIRFISSKRFLMTAFLFGALHLLFMGYEGWMKPAEWHGGLPPISLIAFVFFLVGYVLNIFGRK